MRHFRLIKVIPLLSLLSFTGIILIMQKRSTVLKTYENNLLFDPNSARQASPTDQEDYKKDATASQRMSFQLVSRKSLKSILHEKVISLSSSKGPLGMAVKNENFTDTATITYATTDTFKSAVVNSLKPNFAADKKLPAKFPSNAPQTTISTCFSSRRPRTGQVIRRNGVWQVQAIDDNNATDSSSVIDEVLAFSAFFDDRNLTGKLKPVIRVNALRPGEFQKNELFCNIWYPNVINPIVTKLTVTNAGGGGHIVTNRRIRYTQYLYSCQLLVHYPIPTHVSIVSNFCCNSTMFLPIQRPLPTSTFQHQFATCTETSFGNVEPDKVVEWIEANRMFGVSLFNIYDGAITNGQTLKVLEWYDKQGVVRLTRLPPAVDDQSLEGVKLNSPTSFNDCMMTNMYSTRFMIVLDFDELIVPRVSTLRQSANYSSLVAYIDRKLNLPADGYHTYSFRNTYFFRTYPADERQPMYLTTMRYRFRTPPNGFLYATKSFVNPRKCLSLFNHYCLVRLRGADSKYGVAIDVPTDIALSHHYRGVCEYGEKTCNKYKEQVIADDTMLVYQSILKNRVDRVRSELGLNSQPKA